jgi:hypothetical protein
MNEQIAKQEQQQRAEHRQVAPVPASENLSCNNRQKHGWETEIGDCGSGCPDLGSMERWLSFTGFRRVRISAVLEASNLRSKPVRGCSQRIIGEMSIALGRCCRSVP